MNRSTILIPEIRDIIIQYTLPSIDEVKEDKKKIKRIFDWCPSYRCELSKYSTAHHITTWTTINKFYEKNSWKK